MRIISVAKLLVKLQSLRACIILFSGISGCVHTWCPSTSTRAPAQNGAVLRHWVPDISLPSSVPEYKVETFSSGTGTVPEFWRGYLKKWCVHISAHQESFSGTKSERSLNTRTRIRVQCPCLGSQINMSSSL